MDLTDPALAPWPGFALAAQATVDQLSRLVPLDLWLVTHVRQDEQLVVAGAGPWSELVPAGTVVGWRESFCRQMVLGNGPMVAPVVPAVAAYAERATEHYSRVQAYVGVPLLTADGELFGTLCAFAGEQQQEQLHEHLPTVRLLARLLSTVLAREQDAHDRSQDAARAYAFAERDGLTGVRNRRGWQSALAVEGDRCHRYGWPACVVVVDPGGLTQVNAEAGHAAGDARLVACARLLQRAARPGDVLGRPAGGQFALLALQCDAAATGSLLERLRGRLAAEGVPARLGAATWLEGEDLEQTWARAQAELRRDGQRAPASG